MKLFRRGSPDGDPEPAFEAEVRSFLRQSIVPPPTPQYLRYRLELMDAPTVGATSSGPLELPGVRRAWGRSVAFRLAGSALAMALVATLGFVAVRSQLDSSAASPGFSGAVWQAGAVMSPQMLPNGAAFTYVDGTGLYMTADFGRTWSGPTQIPGADTPRDHLWDMGTLEFADAERGWMVRVRNGRDGSVAEAFRTVDGGQSWQSEPIATYSQPTNDTDFVAAQMHFRSLNDGWLLLGRVGGSGTSDCRRWATADGGRTWAGPVDAACTGLPLVHWVTPTLGYLASGETTEAQVVVTLDGGATWQHGSLGGTWSNPDIRLLTSDGDTLTAVVQEDNTTGTSAAVMVSRDGGASWHRDHDLTPPLEPSAGRGSMPLAITAPESGRWVAASDIGTVMPCPSGTCASTPSYVLRESRDEGRTWTRLGTQPFFNPGGLAWWDGSHGLVMGTSGTSPRGMYRTSDGGETWSPISF